MSCISLFPEFADADVSYWLLQKSKREIYTNPVVNYGFSRGIEPVTYVAIILDDLPTTSNLSWTALVAADTF